LSSPSQRFPYSLVSAFQGSFRPFRLALSALIEVGARQGRPRWLVRRFIGAWVSRFDIDLGECVVPEGGFRTYREFHARGLRPEARPIDSASRVVFPADGFVLDHGRISEGRLTQVKGVEYGLSELVNAVSPALPVFALDGYEGGTYVNLYLPLESCHRWYAPLDGAVVREKRLPGDRLSLDLRSLAVNPGIYARNERLVQELEGEAGKMMLVAVGGIAATNIFSVRPPDAPGPWPCARGEELGGFYLGSSIVILLPRGMAAVPLAGRQPVKMGQALVPGP
jgi:phosphatidylserine decarboxylase